MKYKKALGIYQYSWINQVFIRILFDYYGTISNHLI
jgi:hypothetical protein